MQTALKIRFRNQWGILVVALVLLAGAVVHNLYRSHIDIETGEEQRLLSQVRVVDANLGAQVHRTDHVLKNIGSELGPIPPGDWARVLSNHRIEVIAEAIAGVRTVLAIDPQGVVRLSNRPQLLGSDLSRRDYFQAALKSPDPVPQLSPPFKTLLGVWGMNLVRVITDPQGRFAGIVVATLDPEYFTTLLGSVNYSPDMWSAIAHGDGVMFLMVPEREGQQGKNLAQPGSFFSRHLEGGRDESVLTGTVYTTGEYRMMAQRTVRLADGEIDKVLVVAASRDIDSIFAGWRRHALNQTLTFGVIMLTAVTALAGFQLHQHRQLQQATFTQHALRDTRQQLLEIIDFLPDATFVIDNDKRVVIWNRAIEKMTGIPKEEMIGKGDYEYSLPFYGCRRPFLLDLLDLDDPELSGKYARIRRSGEALDAETFCPALHDGQGAYVWVTVVPLYNAVGTRVGAIESIRDVSERKASENYLRKLTHAIEHSASGMMITDIQGTIEYVNRKFIQLTGYTADEVIGRNPRIFKSEATPREVFDDLWKTILAGKEWRGEIRNRRKSGEVYWSIASINPLHDEQGAIAHFIANFEDISERKNAEATIERLAYYDPLTDLPNRRMLQDRLDLALKRSRRQASCTALLYLDLDRFKHINDTLGHPAGDKLLREMAGRFTSLLRDDDIVFRLGGDEFAVILHDIQHDHDAAAVAQKILEAAIEPLLLDEHEVVVTSSVGIALSPRDGDDGKTLEKHADIALYHAKAEGKNTFRFFSEELNSRLGDRISMEQGLRRILERQELELYYQPKVDLATGKVSGVEALIRWNSPEFGLVSPLRFIPLAEETRQIVPIGEWVLRTACRQQIAWQQEGLDLVMAVNLSAVQFKSPALTEQISAIIDETGIHPECLELELTESALVDKPAEVVRVLERLRYLGCGIAIDDFGTGYSSLSYLKTFPVTTLKIDRSFVRDLAHDSGDRAIAQSVVDLAHNLNMQTVAEGVEQREQLEILRQIGCTFIQGFYFSRPVTAGELPEVVRSLNRSA